MSRRALKRRYGRAGAPMRDLEVEWSRWGAGPVKVVGPAWRLIKSDGRVTGYEKVSGRVTLSRPRQSGHEIEGYVSIRGKRHSAFTSGGTNPDGGDGMIIVRGS
jgi:hypothetical protein